MSSSDHLNPIMAGQTNFCIGVGLAENEATQPSLAGGLCCAWQYKVVLVPDR